MKVKHYFFSAILLIIISGSVYAYKEYNRKNKDLANIQPAATLTVAMLIKKFETNEKEANINYLGKIIAVTGNVDKVIKQDKTNYTVVLSKAGSMSSVRCSMDSIHSGEAEKLSVGSMATIKGTCTGFTTDELLGSDVILNRCCSGK